MGSTEKTKKRVKIKGLDLRVGVIVRRKPRFWFERQESFSLTSTLLASPPPTLEVFASFGREAGLGGIYTREPIIESDPRKFSRIVLYACAIRRGELPEFKRETGLRFAGPAAAALVDAAKQTLPPGTVFPGFTCHGSRLYTRVWVSLINSYHSGTGTRDVDYRILRAALAGSAKVNIIACVE